MCESDAEGESEDELMNDKVHEITVSKYLEIALVSILSID